MVNHAKATQDKLTDFNIGSAARTMLEATAIETEELYQQMWNGLNESIPVAVFNSFNFPALTAKSTTGIARLTITPSTNPTTVSGGTVFTTTDSTSLSFASLTDAIIPAGSSYFDIKVVATVPGVASNVNIGTAFSASPSVPGFVSALAISGFIDGTDAELLADQKNRFVEYISTLSRGTNAAIRYGATTVKILGSTGYVVEQVKSAVVVEPWLTDNTAIPSLIYLYIYNGIGVASGALVNQVSTVIDGYYDINGKPVAGWKAAGVKVIVLSAIIVSVGVTASVTVDPAYIDPVTGAAVTLQAVSDTITAYIADLGIGADVIMAEIVGLAMQVAGVTNFRLVLPSSDVFIAANSKAALGSLSISQAV